jgi:putative transposase
VAYRISEEERQPILLTCNEREFAALPPGQIVPILANRGRYIGSELSLDRVLHIHGQDHQRDRARTPQEPRPLPPLRANGPDQVWSWQIAYLPTTVQGVWIYLYLVIDVWSRKAVARGCRRTGRSNHRGRPCEPGMHGRANQTGPQADADPPRG